MQRAIALNSFLIAIILNISLLIVLSLIEAGKSSLSEDFTQIDISNIHKVSLVKNDANLQQGSDRTSATDELGSDQEDDLYLPIGTYRSIVRELAPFRNEVAIQNVPSQEVGDMQRFIFEMRERRKNQTRFRALRGNNGADGSGNVAQKRIGLLKGVIKIPLISNSADPDNIAEKALRQLSKAINSRQFEFRMDIGLEQGFILSLSKARTDLSDPAILDAPFIYLSAKRQFSLTEEQAMMLCRYLNNGGLVLFSNVADTDPDKVNVESSFGFEFWKILGDKMHNLSEISRDHVIYNFFYQITTELPPILGLGERKLILLYEDSGYGREWASGRSVAHQQLGINIILYAIKMFVQ